MTTIYNRIQCNFTQVSNLALLDNRLSSKAYKLYAYMCFRIGTHPTWEFNNTEILKHFKEGEKAMRIAFNELIEAGFLIRRQGRKERGRFSKSDYEIFAEPINTDSAPQAQNGRAVKRQAANGRAENAVHNNIDINNIDINNIDSTSSKQKEEKTSIEKVKEEIKTHFKIKGYKSNVEEFLMYYKENILETSKKLDYRALKWEEKFKSINPTIKDSLIVEKKMSEEEIAAHNYREAKMEYCKRHHKNPRDLTEDDILLIKKEMKT